MGGGGELYVSYFFNILVVWMDEECRKKMYKYLRLYN